MMRKHIGFNKPYVTGKETKYNNNAVSTGKLSENAYSIEFKL